MGRAEDTDTGPCPMGTVRARPHRQGHHVSEPQAGRVDVSMWTRFVVLLMIVSEWRTRVA